MPYGVDVLTAYPRELRSLDLPLTRWSLRQTVWVSGRVLVPVSLAVSLVTDSSPSRHARGEKVEAVRRLKKQRPLDGDLTRVIDYNSLLIRL
jgi:hypothetical protein